jgi:hypothetical protein
MQTAENIFRESIADRDRLFRQCHFRRCRRSGIFITRVMVHLAAWSIGLIIFLNWIIAFLNHGRCSDFPESPAKEGVPEPLCTKPVTRIGFPGQASAIAQ